MTPSASTPSTPKKPLAARIVAEDLPGDCMGPSQPIVLGIQCRRDVEQLTPATGDRAVFGFEVGVVGEGEGFDFRGPYVHGRRDDRFVYLAWGHADHAGDANAGADHAGDEEFVRFARAKLKFSDLAPDVLQAALDDPGLMLTCTMHATTDAGLPASGTIRPPRATWTVEPTPRC